MFVDYRSPQKCQKMARLQKQPRLRVRFSFRFPIPKPCMVETLPSFKCGYIHSYIFICFHLFPSGSIPFVPIGFRVPIPIYFQPFLIIFTYGFGCGKRKIHPVVALTLNRPLSQEAHEPQEVGGDGRVLVSTVLPDFSICVYIYNIYIEYIYIYIVYIYTIYRVYIEYI